MSTAKTQLKELIKRKEREADFLERTKKAITNVQEEIGSEFEIAYITTRNEISISGSSEGIGLLMLKLGLWDVDAKKDPEDNEIYIELDKLI